MFKMLTEKHYPALSLSNFFLQLVTLRVSHSYSRARALVFYRKMLINN